MRGEFVGLALPGQAAAALQAAVGERVEVALDAAPRDSSQTGDLLVRATVALEP
jgi:hypothetical protein